MIFFPDRHGHNGIRHNGRLGERLCRNLGERQCQHLESIQRTSNPSESQVQFEPGPASQTQAIVALSIGTPFDTAARGHDTVCGAVAAPAADQGPARQKEFVHHLLSSTFLCRIIS